MSILVDKNMQVLSLSFVDNDLADAAQTIVEAVKKNK